MFWLEVWSSNCVKDISTNKITKEGHIIIRQITIAEVFEQNKIKVYASYLPNSITNPVDEGK